MAQTLSQDRNAQSLALMNQISLWLFLTSLTLLIVPVPMLQSLYLQQWLTDYAYLLGLTAVASASFLLANLIRIGLRSFEQNQYSKKQDRQIENKLELLDATERALLREFILQGKSTVLMPVKHGTVEELVKESVIIQVGETEHYAIEGPVGEMKISTAARAKLTRKMLRLPEGELTDAQRAGLRALRPDFTQSLAPHRQVNSLKPKNNLKTVPRYAA